MRLARLDLIAYGGFEGRSIDLSARGLHVVYGANEAGKSTTLRAILGFLYGFDHRTKDAYLVKMSELRVGALVEGPSGESLELVRRKGRENTLLDASGAPVDEAVLRNLLHGLSQEAFRTSFGLDAPRLREGAAALLAGHGDLGEGLFDASLGGSGAAHGLLKDLRGRADALFRPQGSARPLNEALRAYQEAKARVRDLASNPDAYQTQLRSIAEAEAAVKSLEERRAATVLRRLALERATSLWPRKLKRDALAAERDLAIADRMPHETLELLRARAAASRATDAKLLETRAQLASADIAVEQARARLGAGVARPDSRTERDLIGALRQREGLVTRVDAAKGEVVRLEASLEIARDHAAQRPKASLAPLRRAISAANQLSGLSRRPAELEARLAASASTLDKKLRALGRYSGDLDAAVTLAVPSIESLDALAPELDEAARELAAASDRARDRERALAAVEATIAETVAGGAPPEPAHVTRAREERDALWRDVRDHLDAGALEAARAGATRLERATQDADALADALLRDAERVAVLSHQRAERARVERELLDARGALERAAERRSGLEARLAGLFASLEGVTVGALVEMRAWLTKHAALVAEHAARDADAEELRRLRADRDAAREALASELERLGEPVSTTTLDALLSVAEGALERLDALSHQAAKADRDAEVWTVELATARAKLAAAQGELDALTTRLGELASALGLPSDADPDAVQGALSEARELFQKVDAAAALRSTEGALAKEQREFAAWLTETFAVALSDPDDATRALEAAASRIERAERAAKVEGDLAEIEGELAGQDLTLPPDVELLAADPAALAAARETHGRDDDKLEDEYRAAQRVLASRQEGLKEFTGDARAADAASDAQSALARVRALTEEYCRVRLAAEVLSREVDRYRDANQGPVLGRASDLFSRLTRGSFSGVRAGFDSNDRPALRCTRDGEGDLGVDDLSEGAQDQLYLALRIASLERYASAAAPLPLVLDDVLTSFDDDRARAGLEVLVELATRHQVLFFTHHRALVDIARAVGATSGRQDAVTVHELVGRAGSVAVGARAETEAHGVQ
jgi:uncharacterized protein YhaN